ncbi:hypothetical protein IU11_03405 [Cellulosimicrobium sp. MM]|nr:hypothetical protein IU11_03405 [Cellulosimicrobium sp. MM]
MPLRGAEEVALTPGVVTDVSLGGLPAGAYAVSVHADVPVVGGASVDRRGEPDPDLLHEERQYDRAWVAARPLPPVEDAASADESAGSADDASPAGQVALVPGTSSALTLAAVPAARADEDEPTGSLELLVRVHDESGAEAGTTTLTLRAGTTQTLDPATVRAEGSEAVPAAVTVDVVGEDDGLLPVWSLTASAGTPSGDEGDGAPSLVSVLLPVTEAPAAHEVAVRASDTAGLGR